MNQNLKNLIKKLVQEYGTGAGGRNYPKGGGNLQTSPRIGGSFRDDEEEMMDYIFKNVYGGDGGHYKNYSVRADFNRIPNVKFEGLKDYIKQVLEELDERAYGSATLTTQGPPRTGAIAYTDEYPYSVRPKRTATGMFEQEDPTISSYNRDIENANASIRKAQLGIAKRNYELAIDASGKAASAPNKAVAAADKKKQQLFREIETIKEYLKALKAELNDLKLVPMDAEKGTPTPEQLNRMDVLKDYIKGYETEKASKEDAFDKAVDAWDQAMAGKNQAAVAASQASKAARQAYNAARKANKAVKKEQIMNKNILLKSYIKNRKNKDLMELIDLYKREILFEGAMTKFFKLFDEGKSDEEVLRLYAEQGIVVPEQFVTKARKKHEGLKHDKLDLEELERETKNFKKIPLIDEDEVEIKEKILSTRLMNETKKAKEKIQEINKKFKIPLEIKQTLEDTLKMYPLIRFVKNLKAVNSIPPSYRVYLLNNQHFDIYYETYSLMVKIGTKEYYIGNFDEKNYAIKHINKLMTEPILKKGEEEEEDTENIPPPSGMKTPPSSPPPPKEPEPEEPEV